MITIIHRFIHIIMKQLYHLEQYIRKQIDEFIDALFCRKNGNIFSIQTLQQIKLNRKIIYINK